MFTEEKIYKQKVAGWAQKKSLHKPWRTDIPHHYCSELGSNGLDTHASTFLVNFVKQNPKNILVLQAGRNEANFVNNFLKINDLKDCMGDEFDPKWQELQDLYSHIQDDGTPSIETIMKYAFTKSTEDVKKLNLHIGVVDAVWELKCYFQYLHDEYQAGNDNPKGMDMGGGEGRVYYDDDSDM